MIPFFEWDKAKARSNIKKHGVSFENAMAVFQYNTAGLLDRPGLASIPGVCADPSRDKLRAASPADVNGAGQQAR